MIAAQVASAGSLDKIAAEWRMPRELAADLVKLSLYDVVLYVDGKFQLSLHSLRQWYGANDHARCDQTLDPWLSSRAENVLMT